MSNPADRLCLGTAQLGLDYGITNRQGRPSDRACDAILNHAIDRGVLRWDTARAYGDAEARIGRFLTACPRRDRVSIVSKLPDPPRDLAARQLLGWVSQQTEASVRLLGVDQLAGWLIHSATALERWGSPLVDALYDQQLRGLVAEVGVSVYGPLESRLALQHQHLSALQCPFNLLDTRMLEDNVLKDWRASRGTVYARSVFLQGVLTRPASALPAAVQRLAPFIGELERQHAALGYTPLQTALPFALSIDSIDYVVIGVDNAQQLDDNLTLAQQPLPMELQQSLTNSQCNVPTDLLEPRCW